MEQIGSVTVVDVLLIMNCVERLLCVCVCVSVYVSY